MSAHVAWVVGAGSGIGRAIAERLAADGLAVAVSGRRRGPLDEVVVSIEAAGGTAIAVEADVTDDASVTRAHQHIATALGPIAHLVCSAGTNVPNRWWDALQPGDFARVVDTNLTSVARLIPSVLPEMRAAGAGQITVVSSWAGWGYMSVAAGAYSASKRALGAVVETLNDQEGRHGIRGTHLCPGEVITPILLTRPVPPTDEEQARMLRPEHVAEAVSWIGALPSRVCINELVITPTWNRAYVDNSAYTGAQS